MSDGNKVNASSWWAAGWPGEGLMTIGAVQSRNVPSIGRALRNLPSWKLPG
ncbi:hypothetical protein PCANC_00359 [Puccinia coronata f. sp. avenae]|uniref:Uncharacterized protein n=1 Tax=Puccinia coronata f. sp. avenae TaxID=200324 RepID=A0A2N5W9E6_9BASI|nr:hypothetical protein PCANC_00359 [Puccinia coronata f. sp. avenae]